MIPTVGYHYFMIPTVGYHCFTIIGFNGLGKAVYSTTVDNWDFTTVAQFMGKVGVKF